jgi:hypothetical protein
MNGGFYKNIRRNKYGLSGHYRNLVKICKQYSMLKSFLSTKFLIHIANKWPKEARRGGAIALVYSGCTCLMLNISSSNLNIYST